jgi:ribosome-binding factor A
MKNRAPSATGPSQRQRRAGELIRHVLAEMLARGEVHDTNLPSGSVTISEVRPSPDLKHAVVYCTVLGRDDVSEEIEALNKAAGKIRHVLGRKIDLKFTPSLTFRADESFSEAARINSLLRDLDTDDEAGH